MKTKLEKLIQSSTPGSLSLYSNNRVLQIGVAPDCAETKNAVVHWAGFEHAGQPFKEKEANARRLALSWNRFPEAVETLRKIETIIGAYDNGQKLPTAVSAIAEDARALLAAIEKEAGL